MEIRDFHTHLLEIASPRTVKAVAAKEMVDVHLECTQDDEGRRSESFCGVFGKDCGG